MWGWIFCFHVWKVARVKEINVLRSELWFSAFIIIPSVLMSLKQGLIAWHSPPCLLQEIKQILKAKQIIPSKIMPCKPPPTEWYLYKDACRSTQMYLLSFPPVHEFGLAGSLRLSTEVKQCSWLPEYPHRSQLDKGIHFFLFQPLFLLWEAEPHCWSHLPQTNWHTKIWTEPCSCALGVCKAPYFWMPMS